eukprot:5948665-Pyramimonas_sp.AAC.1
MARVRQLTTASHQRLDRGVSGMVSGLAASQVGMPFGWFDSMRLRGPGRSGGGREGAPAWVLGGGTDK